MTHVNFLYRRVPCLTRIFNSCEIACEKTLATAVGGQSNKMKYKFDICSREFWTFCEHGGSQYIIVN